MISAPRLAGPSVPRSAWAGRVLGWVFFGCWAVGLLSGMILLNREGCAERAGPGAGAGLAVVAPGWQMRHWLPADHALTPLIVRQLIARGPLPGTSEEIYLSGAAGGMAARLRAAGWQVRVVVAAGGEPRIEIFGPDRSLQWRGGFRGVELEVAGAVVLDTLILEKIARGEPVAPFVPVGCATPVERAGRVTGPRSWRELFQ